MIIQEPASGETLYPIITSDIRKSLKSEGGVNNLYGWVVPKMCDLIDELRNNVASLERQRNELREQMRSMTSNKGNADA